MNETVIQAKGLTKIYDSAFALNNFSFELKAGRILGLIGPNGAGKTTALRCLMGMTTYHGQLEVLGQDPRKQRMSILQNVAYIADTAILPKWITVAQLFDYSAGVHPKFDLDRAKQFLAQTEVMPNSKIAHLSKGMITQVHLALAISIDAKLLVLDEPTIGLDILYRKQFYQQLLNDYFDEQRTIIITTHQVEEIEHVLTDLLFIKNGSPILDISMDELGEEFSELTVDAANIEQARTLKPVHERDEFGAKRLIYRNVPESMLRPLGKLRTPSVADLFVAMMA